jgi:hypothetical protein
MYVLMSLSSHTCPQAAYLHVCAHVSVLHICPHAAYMPSASCGRVALYYAVMPDVTSRVSAPRTLRSCYATNSTLYTLHATHPHTADTLSLISISISISVICSCSL